ncbi:hypothetical protein [Pararhizobium sp.]|uniref:hypothetical protein n=1 Tax=Pararhizobium sp. TaxID=1977563 RepID=UPI003D142317
MIDFENETVVKRLAQKVKREVRSWGDPIRHLETLTIIARMFGHDSYQSLHARLGLANPSEPDSVVGPEERRARYRQYIQVLVESDFPIEDAEHLLENINHGPWWEFSGEWVASPSPRSNVRAAAIKIEFMDTMTVERLFGVFRNSLRAQGLVVEEGARHVFAKMFGHQSFSHVLDAVAKGKPSVPDFFLAPEALDDRVSGYLSVLGDAGIGEDDALPLLREGFGGWFAIEENEWESLRQPRRADKVQNGRRPRWRPRR